jgi:putative copper export protein
MWELVRWIHLLAMAFFVGGQLMLAAVVVPVLRGGDQRPLRAAARRFTTGALVALALLVATGVAMASHYGDWDRTAL